MSYNFEINKFKNKPILFSDSKKIANIAKIIAKLPKNSSIIIREYHLDEKSRKEFAQNVIKLAKKNNIKVIIGKNIELAKKLGANGVHFSDLDKLPIQLLKKSAFKKDFILSIACHSEKSLLKYRALGIDKLFLSPIFTTSSHNSAKIFGFLNLAKITSKHKKYGYVTNRLYALGGVRSDNLKKLRKINITGFGAIDYFLED